MRRGSSPEVASCSIGGSPDFRPGPSPLSWGSASLHGPESGFFLDQLASRSSKERLDKIRRIDAAPKVGILQNCLFKWNRCLDAGDHVFAQCSAHLVHGVTTVFAIGDKLP